MNLLTQKNVTTKQKKTLSGYTGTKSSREAILKYSKARVLVTSPSRKFYNVLRPLRPLRDSDVREMLAKQLC